MASVPAPAAAPGPRALTPRRLADDFAAVPPGATRDAAGDVAGGASDEAAPGLGRALARACYDALGTPGGQEAARALDAPDWRRLFAPAIGEPAAQVAQAAQTSQADAYRGALGLRADAPVDPARALRALQTGYAALIKLITARAIQPGAGERFGEAAALAPEALRAWLQDVQSGRALAARGLGELFPPDGYAWCSAPEAWTPALTEAVRAIAARLAAYDVSDHVGDGAPGDAADDGPRDRFRPLYERTIPHAIRHALGEFYTPRWLAQAVLADLPAPPGWRGLDPCCGSGAFVVELIGEVLAETAGAPAAERLEAVLSRVHGLDLNPLAVLTARANYALAIAPLLPAPPVGAPGPDGAGATAAPARAIAIPVRRADALAEPDAPDWGRFERVVGNPPWVEWKDLPAGYREAVQDQARARGLFSDDGYAGGTDLNICLLIAHLALEHRVARGGALAFLMPRQLLQTRSGQGFRRLRLPDGAPIALERLADWTALRPFEAACQPMTYVLRRDAESPAIVPVRAYRVAEAEGAGARARRAPTPDAPWRAAREGLRAAAEGAMAVDADGGPYLFDAPEVLPRLHALMGACAYRGRRATETSPHGVFWVRPAASEASEASRVRVENALNPRARDGVARREAELERDRLFPLLRGAAIRPFRAAPEPALVILPHTAETGAHPLPPEAMPPETLAYLTDYRETLAARGSYREYRAGGPFYGLWRVGPYTFAPHKVVWPEMGELRAAVIGTAPTPWGEEKLLIPEGKVNLVACASEDEAHYLCALLNAPLLRRAYQRVSSQIGRPSRLPFALPAYDAARWSHRALAAVSRAAHVQQATGTDGTDGTDGTNGDAPARGARPPARQDARRDALLDRLLGRVIG